MTYPDPSASALGILAFLGWAGAVFERIRNAKVAREREANTEAISDAKKHQERAEVMSKLADEYRALFEREHKELTTYRDEVHTKARKDQEIMAKKDERIIELQSRPDFTDLFEHLKTQSDVSVQILHGIEGMVAMMGKLLERESIMHKNVEAL